MGSGEVGLQYEATPIPTAAGMVVLLQGGMQSFLVLHESTALACGVKGEVSCEG